MGRTTADFEGAIYGITLDVDLKNQSRYAVYLSQAGLGLPDRDYYLNSEFRSQKTQYQAYVAKLLQLAGWPNPEASAEHVVKFETKIAEVSWTKTQDRDLSASYNLMSVDELTQMAPPFDWHMFLEAAGLRTVNRIVVAEKGAFPEIARIYELTDVRTLQSWQAFHVIDNAAFYLSKPFTDAYFELHDKVLAGQEDQQIRWKRGVHAVSGGDCTSSGSRFDCFGDLGWAVGQLYTAKYFPPEAKTTIEALVANVKAAFRGRIANLDWMSEQTKTEAIRKLDTYTLKVGYPDHPRDYSNVVIRDDDAIGNARRAGAANWRFYVNRLGGPVDRTDWTMTPQTNDAYQGSLRDIAFPVAFLQPPIFDPDADDAINYGAIGGAIGHELTHGFDDEGRKIDADGTLRDWWTREDAETYKARADRLGQQYNQYEPIAGVHINGDLTMGENIADLGGLTLAIDSYRSSLHGSPSPVIDRVSGDQRVLLGWAQAWRGKERDETIRQELASEPYSPAKFRVNGVVRNLDGWYEAFHIAPTDKLYLKPEQRVHIW
jgi:putative endopeptidase